MLHKKDYLMDIQDAIKTAHSSVDELGEGCEYIGWIVQPFELKRYRVYQSKGGNIYIPVPDDELCD